jgi:hypothetical protein
MTRAALGYFHANCGHCHNPHGLAWATTQMWLRLDVAEHTGAPEATHIMTNTVGAALQEFSHPPYTTRIVAGDPAMSEIIYRISTRGSMDQMPPLATEHVDPTGVSLLTAWIQSL